MPPSYRSRFPEFSGPAFCPRPRAPSVAGMVATWIAALLLAASPVLSGCSRERSLPEAVGERVAGAPHPNRADVSGQHPTTSGDPTRWAFPPGQGAPWPIHVAEKPLEPSRQANTGDFRGPWPDYRVPTEIRFTSPPVPAEIARPSGPPPQRPEPSGN